MLRGLVFAGAMVVLRLVQGALINAWQTQSGLISIVLLLIFVVGVAFWGVRDGRADATANPDPDRRADLAMTWLLAELRWSLLGLDAPSAGQIVASVLVPLLVFLGGALVFQKMERGFADVI